MSKSITPNHLGRFSLNQCNKINIRDATEQIKVVQTKEILENMFWFPLTVYETQCHF